MATTSSPANEDHRLAEDRLLVGCLRGQIDPGDTQAATLVTAARRTGFSGLLLEAASREEVILPPAAMDGLKEHASEIAARNLHLGHTFAPLARGLDDAGIPSLLMKGAALLLSVYDRPDLRPMADVDLLVRAEDVPRADKVLCGLGCRRGRGQVRDDFFPRYYYEREYVTGHTVPLRIDLHARPLRPARYWGTVPDDDFWAGARRMTLDGAQVRVPSHESMVIHLAAHAACHGSSRLLWLYDIKRYVDAHGWDVDWPLLVDRARRWRLVLPVRQALARVEAVWGRTVPASALVDLRRSRVGLLDRLALWHAPRDQRHPVRHVLVNVLCARGLRFRVGYLLSMVLPGRQHMASIYRRRHAGWLACAHVYRWVRAAVRPLVARV